MFIASGAPVVPMPLATQSALSHRKITDRCARSNDSLVAALCGNGRKASITTRLRPRATKGAGVNADIRLRNLSPNYPVILRAVVTRPSVMAGGVYGIFHRRVVRREDRIED